MNKNRSSNEIIGGKSSQGLEFKYSKAIVIALGTVAIVCLALIFTSAFYTFGDYKRNLGPEGNIQIWLKSNPNRFNEDSYEMLVTINKMQADCFAFDGKVIGEEEFNESLESAYAKISHFNSDTKLGEMLKKHEAYTDAYNNVHAYLNDVELFKEKKIGKEKLVEAFNSATESFSILNSDARMDGYKITDALISSINSFKPLAENAFVQMLSVFILCFACIVISIALAIKLILREQSKVKTIERLIASIGHDLRSPLQAIQNANSLLAGDLNASSRRQYAGIVKSSTKILSRLVDDIVQMVQREELSYINQPVDIASWFTSLVISYSKKCELKGLNFVHSIECDYGFYEFDPDRISQCIGNLIENSIKFTAEGSIYLNVKVIYQGDDSLSGLMKIEVKDTGIGISEQDIKTIIEPFERGSNVSDTDGSGLGLSIVNSFANVTGGSLRVSSSLNNGSTFFLDVPIKKFIIDYPGSISEPDRSRGIDLNSKDNYVKNEVLLVDDDQNIRDTIYALLTTVGYSVTTASNGKEALAMLIDNHHSVVLTDIQMPAMNGFDLAESCSKLARKPYLIAMTAHGKNLSSDKRFSLFDKLLLKPVEENDFLDAVEAGLNVSKANLTAKE